MKTKKYLTSKRKWEIKKRKALVLFMAILIGIGSIATAYLGLVTPLMATSYDLTLKTPRIADLSPTEPLTIEQHICLASNGEYCDLLVNLAKCESSLNKEAIHINSNGTYDAGLYQWNSIHIKSGKITLSCALDVYCSTRKTLEEIKKGHLNWWVCAKKI